MPRAIWSGAITFGLLNVPVKMLSAVSEHKLHFHFVHKPDGGRIGYRKICKVEDEAVPDEEIIRAYEWSPGEWVEIGDEDFAAARGESHRRIEIRDFVPYEQIDPVYFERTYALIPDSGAERAYAVLAKAMAEEGRAAIATFIMRDRQNLACLRVRDGRTITLERMHFADEVRATDELVPAEAVDQKVDPREIKMAKSLIESLATDFDPGAYADTYRDALMEIIEAKQRGETIEVSEDEGPRREPSDLVAALEASIEAAQDRFEKQGGKGGKGAKKRSAKPKAKAKAKAKAGPGGGDGEGNGLGSLSKEELYKRAQDADVPGRSQMSKEELAEALSSVAG